MSYVVLARKWRPMKFEEVVSQDHVSTTLKNAIENDRLASAYIFSGPRGVGKTTTARIFAKAINCDNGLTSSPCNTCVTCSEITASRNLDVFEIDGASNRGIDEVRNLRENLRYAASKGKHKIYIIDEVHMLTTEAFNALLKTLEEPPSRVLFIFATTEFHKVPATILSRCQRYDFRRIPTSEIADKLRLICDAEKIKIDDESLFLLARKADGSLRDSQSLLDQVISFCGAEVKFSELTDLLGVINFELFFECSDIIAEKNVGQGLHLVEKIFTHGYDMAEFLSGLAEHFRNMLIVKATGETTLIEGLDAYNERYKKAIDLFSETDLLRQIQMATESAYQVKRSTNPRLHLEMAVIKMIKMDKSVELGELLASLKSPGGGAVPAMTLPSSEGKLDADKTPPVKASKASTSGLVTVKQIKNTIQDEQPEDVSSEQQNNSLSKVNDESEPSPVSSEEEAVALEKIKSEWNKIVDDVKQKKIHLGSFLNEGFPTALSNNTLEISFGKNSGFHLNIVEQNKSIVKEVIGLITGFNLAVQCHKNESETFPKVLDKKPIEAPPVLNSPPEVEVKSGHESNDYDALQIPVIRKVIDIFDGELVNVDQ